MRATSHSADVRGRARSGPWLSLTMAVVAFAMVLSGGVMFFGETEVIRAGQALRAVTASTFALPTELAAKLPPALARREVVTAFADPCLRSHELALAAGDRITAGDTLYVCEAILETGLRRAPQDGRAWAVLGLVKQRRGASSQDVSGALRLAAALAPRRQDVALTRVVLALRMGEDLPADLRQVLRADLAMLTDLRYVSELLAQQYVDHPEIRDRMAAHIETLDAGRQENFVRTVRRVIRRSGSDP